MCHSNYCLKMKQKGPVYLFYSGFDDEKDKCYLRCLDCNAEVIAKSLRSKSHHEKCPELNENKNK